MLDLLLPPKCLGRGGLRYTGNPLPSPGQFVLGHK